MSKVLYFECKMGAAGDMLMGALYDLLPEEKKAEFLHQLHHISDHVAVDAEVVNKKGIGGIHMHVMVHGDEEHSHDYHHEHNHHHDHDHDHHDHDHDHHHDHHDHDHDHHHELHHHHEHTDVNSIMERIWKLDVSEEVKKNATEIYTLIAMAESKVHQTTMEQIHFHEVGSLDALVDVVGCCLAIEMLEVDQIQASPICTGNGFVRCAHGILPVPAPATAEIIKGIPTYMGNLDVELLTPTGAAILKHFVGEYTKNMDMQIEQIGYGFGSKELMFLNCVRGFLGHKES